ncbi:hypothetical protein Taro_006962 [Colocasia esculenta]|uniref:4-hydroxy-tetrahydrodipicolinate reductase n=1 Tax=Colocasia esculenta TaxID=4460 RepID=A0A843TWV9_COLES|nr:hypothetical protein [Colocasia esculenta]
MASLLLPTQGGSTSFFTGARTGRSRRSSRSCGALRVAMSSAATTTAGAAAATVASKSNVYFPIMSSVISQGECQIDCRDRLARPCNSCMQSVVNGCAGKMGKAVAEAAVSAGLQLIPASFSGPAESGQMIHVGSTEVHLHGPSEKEDVLSSVLDKYPNAIVVDFTVPDAVNPNAELYCKIGVPFVMGTTGGDREKLYKTVEDSNVYAVISPQMGKQVVAFLAAMEIMADQFPGAFSGYSLQVVESHQASKLDTSGTAKAIISCFKKLGVSFELDQIQQIRDPQKQLEVVGVPEEYLSGHAFHLYHLTSPDNT